VKQLLDYMQARAKMEGVRHDLPLGFYQVAYEQGTRTFFGVTLDDDGNLLEDVQQPVFFREYQSQREADNSQN
jgi:hypothetical protein